MSQSTPPSYLRSAEYAAIEAAMMQSEKGRGFLRDYLRRNRSAETEALLDAIAKLQRSLDDQTGAQRLEDLRLDLRDMQRFITRALRDNGALGQAAGFERQPANVIANAVEALRNIALMLHGSGAPERLGAQVERQADIIRDAAAEMGALRDNGAKLQSALQHVHADLMAMLDLWDVDARMPEDFASANDGESLQNALKKGLIEELTFAMLSDDQKAALFN